MNALVELTSSSFEVLHQFWQVELFPELLDQLNGVRHLHAAWALLANAHQPAGGLHSHHDRCQRGGALSKREEKIVWLCSLADTSIQLPSKMAARPHPTM